MTYSMETPMSDSRSEVKSTPPELMFLVSPECMARSDPLRVIAMGNCKVKRRDLLCSTLSNLVSPGNSGQPLIQENLVMVVLSVARTLVPIGTLVLFIWDK